MTVGPEGFFENQGRFVSPVVVVPASGFVVPALGVQASGGAVVLTDLKDDEIKVSAKGRALEASKKPARESAAPVFATHRQQQDFCRGGQQPREHHADDLFGFCGYEAQGVWAPELVREGGLGPARKTGLTDQKLQGGEVLSGCPPKGVACLWFRATAFGTHTDHRTRPLKPKHVESGGALAT